MKGIGHQGERVHGKTGAQLNAEEDNVDGEHHLDARRLGPTHPGALCGHGRRRTGETQEMKWQMCRCLGVSSWGCGCRAQRERRSWCVVLVELKMDDDEDEIINQSAAWLRLAAPARGRDCRIRPSYREFDIPIKKGRSNPNRTATTFPPLSTLATFHRNHLAPVKFFPTKASFQDLQRRQELTSAGPHPVRGTRVSPALRIR